MVRRRLPSTRPGKVHRVEITDRNDGQTMELYIRTGHFEDGSLGEVFLTIGKEGSTLRGLLDSAGILISFALQYGADLASLHKKFEGMRFPPAGPTDNPDIPECTSLMDYVFAWLGSEYGNA